MAELIYGIRQSDNEVVNIEDIPKELRGLRCGCICPHCKSPIVARIGEKREPHFAHHSVKTGDGQAIEFYCDIEKANESALHLMAKQIIAHELAILIPQKLISPEEANMAELIQNIEARIPPFVYQPSKLIEAQSADLEVHLNGFTPDVLIKTKRGELLVEICVRHKVNESKIAKVREYNAAMLEIDLSGYLDTSITRNELRDIIMGEENIKRWIHYPLSDSAIKKAQDYYENLKAVKSYRRYLVKKEAREKKVKLLFEPSNYANTLKCLRSDEEFLKKYAEIHQSHYFDFGSYFKKHGNVPFFIDIPITGEMIFQCDRRIWQSIIFNRYIYGRKEDHARFNKENLFDILKDEYKISVDYDLTYKLPNPLRNNENIHLRRQVIERYLKYLVTIGFIYLWKSNWITVKVSKSIEPSNKIAADYLVEALQNVDLYSPNIDRLISNKMNAFFEELKQQKLLKQMAEEAESQAQSEVHEETRRPPTIKYRHETLSFVCDVCNEAKRENDMMITYQNNRGICCDCYYKE